MGMSRATSAASRTWSARRPVPARRWCSSPRPSTSVGQPHRARAGGADSRPLLRSRRGFRAALQDLGRREPVRKGGRALYDAAILVDAGGTIVLKHRKINLLAYLMDPPYAPGRPEDIRVVATPFGTIGTIICADSFVDDHLARLAAQQPDFVYIPYGWAERRRRGPSTAFSCSRPSSVRPSRGRARSRAERRRRDHVRRMEGADVRRLEHGGRRDGTVARSRQVERAGAGRPRRVRRFVRNVCRFTRRSFWVSSRAPSSASRGSCCAAKARPSAGSPPTSRRPSASLPAVRLHGRHPARRCGPGAGSRRYRRDRPGRKDRR